MRFAGKTVRKTVAAAGTAEKLGTGSCSFLLIQAELDNVGTITVGGQGVNGAPGTRDGYALNAAGVGDRGGGIEIDESPDVDGKWAMAVTVLAPGPVALADLAERSTAAEAIVARHNGTYDGWR